jgi:biopolymer transport protein ExbD
MHRSKRKIQEINSTSSADIAFLLLVFFLVTSSFDAKTGLYRKMAPPDAENRQEVVARDILEDNLLPLAIHASGAVVCKGEEIPIEQIRALGKAFLSASDLSQHVIALEVSREVRYQVYLSVIGELTAAYNDLRNEESLRRFQQTFPALTTEQRDSIRTLFPMHIAENEPEGGQP